MRESLLIGLILVAAPVAAAVTLDLGGESPAPVQAPGGSEGGDAEARPMLAVDPSGDAKVHRADGVLGGWGHYHCLLLPHEKPEDPEDDEAVKDCRQTMQNASEEPAVGAASDATAQDAPGLDMLGIAIRETPEVFTVEMLVRDLQDPPTRIEPNAPYEHQVFYVEFYTGADNASEPGMWYGVLAEYTLGAVPSAYAAMMGACWDPDDQTKCIERCPGYIGLYCEVLLEPRIVAGTPGRLEIDIPRAYLPGLGEGTELHSIDAKSQFFVTAEQDSMIAVAAVQAGDTGPRTMRAVLTHWDDVDRLDPQGVNYTARIDGTDIPPTQGVYRDPLGESGDPRVDLQAVRHHDTADTLSVEVEFGATAGDEDQRIEDYLVFDTFDLVLSAQWDGTTWRPLAEVFEYSLDSLLSDGLGDRNVTIPRFAFQSDVTGPSPSVTWEVARADLPAIPAGSRTGASWPGVYLGSSGPEHYRIGPVQLESDARGNPAAELRDQAWPGPIHWFEHGSTPDAAGQPPFAAYDAADDHQTPTDVAGIVDPAYLDLRHLIIDPQDEGRTAISIGVQELEDLEPPLGYDGVVFAAGVRTQFGDYMVGFWKDENIQGGFCAPDSLVFRDEPSDPRSGWQTLAASLQRPSTNGQQPVESSTAGIVVVAPPECFGGTAEAPAVLEVGAARSLLAQSTGNGMEFWTADDVDAVEADTPLLLGTLPETQSRSVPTGPFGVDNFWDILGVALAVLVALSGMAVAWARRRRLRGYMMEIDRAEAVRDDGARETVLGAIGTRLDDQMQRGRISEGHYQIIRQRIDGLVGRARISRMGQMFKEVPYGIAAELQEMLKDGRISGREEEIVVRKIRASQIPEAHKKRVLSRVHQWRTSDS